MHMTCTLLLPSAQLESAKTAVRSDVPSMLDAQINIIQGAAFEWTWSVHHLDAHVSRKGRAGAAAAGYRHNEIRDVTADLLSEVCHHVGTEPCLQEITEEQLTHRTANKDGARLDIVAEFVWEWSAMCILWCEGVQSFRAKLLQDSLGSVLQMEWVDMVMIQIQYLKLLSVQHFELGDNIVSALGTSFHGGLKLWRTQHNSQELHPILYFASPSYWEQGFSIGYIYGEKLILKKPLQSNSWMFWPDVSMKISFNSKFLTVYSLCWEQCTRSARWKPST